MEKDKLMYRKRGGLRETDKKWRIEKNQQRKNEENELIDKKRRKMGGKWGIKGEINW